ncbi:MAG: ribbon-helix-helix protein, CopG family [Armatimonadota bacterium]|nr:ribbon-helix-helix protein, CopG family [Armatimonadota bacterium]
MKRKVGTTLDAALYERVKEVARRQGRGANEVIEEALSRFLAGGRSRRSAVSETKGTYKVPARALRAVLREDLYGAD